MSKKVLRIASLTVACFIMLSLFTACGAANTAKETASTATPAAATAAATATAAPVENKPVEIDWLAYVCNAQPDTESEIIKQQEEWYNIKFNFWYVDEKQYDEMLGVKLASGEMPDVLRIPRTNVIEKYVKMGVLTPITDDMLNKVPVLAKQINEAGGKDATLDAMYDGKLYGIKYTSLNGTYPNAVVWRTDWLKNVGINKMPETITEYEDAMYKFRNNDPDKNQKKDTYGMSSTAFNMVFGAFGQIPMGSLTPTGGLWWTKKDNKYVYSATQPEMKEALALLQKWYKDGLIDPEYITGENTGGYWALTQAFSNGKIGVTGSGAIYHWVPPLVPGGVGTQCYEDFIKVNPGAKQGETFTLGKAPVGPKGISGTSQGGAVVSAAVAFTTKMAKDPKKIDAVLNMWNSISTDFERYVYAIYGVKDKHHVVDPVSGQISRIKEYAAGDATTRVGALVTTACCENFEFAKKTMPLRYEFMDKNKGTGHKNYLIPATEAKGKYESDLNRMAAEAYNKIISGELPVDHFDEFVKTFNEKGGAEVEKQVNEMVAKLIGK